MDQQIWIVNETLPFSQYIIDNIGKENVVNLDPSLEFFKTFKSFITGGKEIDLFDPTLSKLLTRHETDYIISSFPLSRNQAIDYPELAIRNNIEGVYLLALSALKSKSKIVHINYFSYLGPGIIQLCNETVEKIFDFVGVDYTIINPPILYDEKGYNPVYQLLESAYTEPKTIYFDPETTHPFMHTNDFARAIVKMIRDFRIYEGTANNFLSKEKFTFERIIELSPKELHYKFDADKDFIGSEGDEMGLSVAQEIDMIEGIDRIIEGLDSKYGK